MDYQPATREKKTWPRCKGGKRCYKKAIALVIISAQQVEMSTGTMKSVRLICYCCAAHANGLTSQDQNLDIQPFVKCVRLLHKGNITETIQLWPPENEYDTN